MPVNVKMTYQQLLFLFIICGFPIGYIVNCSNFISMWSICKKELNQFFSNLTGYLAIILFMLVNGLFLFVFSESSIFDFGYASLDRFFELAPWVLLFLVPAITMRSLSDEFKAGTFEILQTKPLTSWQIVTGKYLSVLIIILFVVIPTLICLGLFLQQSVSVAAALPVMRWLHSWLVCLPALSSILDSMPSANYPYCRDRQIIILKCLV